MIRELFAQPAKIVSQLVQQPMRVLFISSTLVFIGLIFDGSLIRLWRLHKDSQVLESRMQILQSETKSLEKKITLAKDPQFIELEARERFDLANEGDLVFVFSDEE